MDYRMMVAGDPSLVPSYAHAGDAGLDLRLAEDVTIGPHTTRLVGTGVRVAIPGGCFGAIYPRSGLATKRGIRLANCVGVVDSPYRGEVMLPLRNDSEGPQELHRGERVAQMVVQPYVRVRVETVPCLDQTERGEGGFGSTGIR